MNVTEALNARRSCRAFTPEPVDKETILSILEKATRAPSWANTQPWEIFVAGGETLNRLRHAYLTNFKENVPRRPDIPAPKQWPQELQKRIDDLGKLRFNVLGIEREDKVARQRLGEHHFKFFNAPVVIYLCMDRSLAPWSLFDLGALSQNILLTAQEQGLGTIPAFALAAYPDIVRAELGIPEHLAVVLGIALGHSDVGNIHNQFRSPRRPIEGVVTFKGF